MLDFSYETTIWFDHITAMAFAQVIVEQQFRKKFIGTLNEPKK